MIALKEIKGIKLIVIQQSTFSKQKTNASLLSLKPNWTNSIYVTDVLKSKLVGSRYLVFVIGDKYTIY